MDGGVRPDYLARLELIIMSFVALLWIPEYGRWGGDWKPVEEREMPSFLCWCLIDDEAIRGFNFKCWRESDKSSRENSALNTELSMR